MKRYLLFISVIVFAIAACKKKSTTSTVDPAVQAAADDALIQTYLTANKITATKDPSGVYYRVLEEGTGDYPTASSSVAVSYTGRLLDTSNTVFATQSSIYIALSSRPKGFQIGVEHINKGGTIQFFIPSGLAYGTAGYGSIPANTPIMYNLSLQGFN